MDGAQTERGRTPAIVYATCMGLPLAVVLLCTLFLGIPPRAILGDASTYVLQPFYLGLISNFGVLCWWTAAVACFVAASVLPTGVERNAALTAGALSALLGLDDLMLLHDDVLAALGIGQSKTLVAYALLIASYLWAFRHVHLRMHFGLLAIAVCFLGLSVAIDVAVDSVLPRLPSGWLQAQGDKWFAVDLAANISQRQPSIDIQHTHQLSLTLQAWPSPTTVALLRTEVSSSVYSPGLPIISVWLGQSYCMGDRRKGIRAVVTCMESALVFVLAGISLTLVQLQCNGGLAFRRLSGGSLDRSRLPYHASNSLNLHTGLRFCPSGPVPRSISWEPMHRTGWRQP